LRRRHRIKLREFNGDTPFEDFWTDYLSCSETNSWTDNKKVAHLKNALVGKAKQVLWDTVDALMKLLRDRLVGTRYQERYKMEFRARRRCPGESRDSLCSDF